MGGGWEWPRGWEEGKGMGQLETKKGWEEGGTTRNEKAAGLKVTNTPR